MVCATAVQLSGRAGWLLQLLIAVCLLTQWCESQCSPPGGVTVVEVDWSLTSAQDGSLQNQLNAESGDVLFFCCPNVSSDILVVSQADFNACNTTAPNLADDYSCSSTNGQVVVPTIPIAIGTTFHANETYYFISNNKTECDSGLKLPVSVFEEGKLPATTAPPTTTASTNEGGGGSDGGSGSTTPSGTTNTGPVSTTDPPRILGVTVVVFAGSVAAIVATLVLLVCGTIVCLVVIVKIKHRKGSVNDSSDLVKMTQMSEEKNGYYKQNGGSELVDSGSSKLENSFSSDEVTPPAAQQGQQALKSPSRPAPKAPAPKAPALSSLPASGSSKPPPPYKPAMASLPVQHNRGPASPARKPPPPPINRFNNGHNKALLPPK